jgi:hypothetical protein
MKQRLPDRVFCGSLKSGEESPVIISLSPGEQLSGEDKKS